MNFLLFRVMVGQSPSQCRPPGMMLVSRLPLLPVFLPLVSWIILTATTSLTVPEYQRGVQGNIIIIFIPHHPGQRFFLCLFVFSLSFSSCSPMLPLRLPHRQVRGCALQNGSLDGGAFGGLTSFRLFNYYFIYISQHALPPPLSQVTQCYQPHCSLFYRESSREKRERGGDWGWCVRMWRVNTATLQPGFGACHAASVLRRS